LTADRRLMSEFSLPSDPDQSPISTNLPTADLSIGSLREHFRPALLSLLVLTFLTGALFPLMLFVVARAFFPAQANGSLLSRQGVVIGSNLIGQNFSGAGYFHPRPSAAGSGYDGASSGGTNLGPSNPKLRDGSPDDPTTPTDESFVGIRQLADQYRRINGVAPGVALPIDAVTRSGSGLDPDISPANAALQISRVARARDLSTDAVRRLVAKYTSDRQLGFLGEPRVTILPLNFELDQIAPLLNPVIRQSTSSSEAR